MPVTREIEMQLQGEGTVTLATRGEYNRGELVYITTCTPNAVEREGRGYTEEESQRQCCAAIIEAGEVPPA